MSSKTRLSLLIIFIIALVSTLAAGCSVGREKWEDTLKKNNAFNQSVIYYGNQGQFETNDYEKCMYYTPNSLVYNLGIDSTEAEGASDSEMPTLSRKDYLFDGWYFVEVDKDGNPVFEDTDNAEALGIAKSTGEAVDFTTLKIAENQKIYLVAKWRLDYQIEYILVSDVDVQVTVTQTNDDGDTEQKVVTYKNGDIITSQRFGTLSSATALSDSSMPVSTNATFLQLYADAECTTELVGDISKPTEDGLDNPKVYAKYITGKWTVVKTATQVISMMGSLNKGTNYWIHQDIDCTGKTTSLTLATKKTNSVIEGNGHTISNLTFSQTLSNNLSYSIFGTLESTAVIKNITFENVSIETSLRTGSAYVYIAYADAVEGATLENVAINSVSVTISCPANSYINGSIMTNDGAMDTANMLYGGTNILSGITITNSTCTVKH